MYSENLVNEVLDRLSKLQKLPKEGFLCGGAVANTILSIIDNKEYPINDLDVFLIDTEGYDSNTALRIPNNELIADGYQNRIISPSNNLSYKISKTENVDLINYVYVNIRNYRQEVALTEERKFTEKLEQITKEYYKIILDSFDINCCKVGINLSNKEFFITEDFKNFVNNRQLFCCNPVTPSHSALRLLKKKKELNAYLDKEEQFKYLSQFFLFNKNAFFTKTNITLFFGKKYKEIFHTYKNEISEFFQLKSYGKVYRDNVEKENLQVIKINNLQWWEYPSNTKNATNQYLENIHNWYEKKLWTLYPTKYVELDSEIKKYHNPEFGSSPTILKRLWELLHKQTKKQKNKSIKFLNRPEFYPFIILGDDFHNCDFNDTNIDKLSNFIEENPTFIKLMITSKLNFQESENLMMMIKKSFPQEIELFCELVSKEIEDESYFKNNFNRKLVLDKEYITNKYNQIKSILSIPLVEKLDLSEFEYNDVIKELVSPLDLLWGGKFMHNCLKGYVDNGQRVNIENGKMKVFVISDEFQRSALQISKSYANTFRIDQIYGHSNGAACNKHKKIADYLIKFLEYKHYLSESEKIINDFKNNRLDIIDNITKSDYSIDDKKSLPIFDQIIPAPIQEWQPIEDIVDVRNNGLTIDDVRFETYDDIFYEDNDDDLEQ